MPVIKRLTENDDPCPACDLGVQVVLEITGRGVEFRSDIFDACEDPDTPEGMDRYYLHFNQRP
jgi:hypothetical protein